MSDRNKSDYDLLEGNWNSSGRTASYCISFLTEDDLRSDEEKFSDVSIRSFKVTAMLSSCNLVNKQKIDFDFTEKDGGTYLTAPVPAVKSKLEFDGATMELGFNDNHEVSVLSCEFLTNNADNAKKMFLNKALKLIDIWSYASQSPIGISRLKIDDINNRLAYYEVKYPYQHVDLSMLSIPLYDRLDPIYALYREGLNSSSDYYRFLCMYKILEGLIDVKFPELLKEAKQNGINLSTKKQVFPRVKNKQWEYFQGKSIPSIYNNSLRPNYRNAVAHFSFDDGKIIDLSLPSNLLTYQVMADVTEICARIMVNYYSELLTTYKDLLQA